MYTLVVAFSCLLALVSPAVASPKQFVDDQHKDVESIARALCQKGDHLRIGHLSTIDRLHSYFASSADRDLTACADRYSEPLSKLKQVLDTESQNVCTNAKVDQIDTFHWDYIVSSLARKWRTVSARAPLPEPLRIFFMNYANELAAKCKETLLGRLNEASQDVHVKAEDLFSGSFGLIADSLSIALVPQHKIKNTDDFILMWDQFVDQENKKGRTVEVLVDPNTNRKVFQMLKVKDPEKAWRVQDRCRHELSPVFEATVLPVMRLINMGYGGENKGWLTKRREAEGGVVFKNWYAMTQLCHLLEPISFYRDSALKVGEMGMMTSTEEAKTLEGNPTASAERPQVRVSPVTLDGKLTGANDDKIVKQVKADFKARGRMFRQIVTNIVSKVKGEMKSKLKRLFVSKKTKDNKFVAAEDGASLMSKSLAETKRMLKEAEMADDETALVRSKRRTKFVVASGVPQQRTTSVSMKIIYAVGLGIVLIAVIFVFYVLIQVFWG